MHFKRLAPILCYFGMVHGAAAAGYGLHEFSATAMGAAFAGSAAADGDASFLAYNPAVSAGVSYADVAFTASGILPNSSARYSIARTSFGTPLAGDATPRDFVDGALVPSFSARLRLSRRWSAGLAVYAPWNFVTDYNMNSVERYYGERTKLMTINLTPSVAYECSPWLVLAAGMQIEYADGSLSSAVDTGTLGALLSVPGALPGAQDSTANFYATNWAVGYTFGATARLSEAVTVGISYQSAIHHHFKGSMSFQLDPTGIGSAIRAATGLLQDSAASAKVTTPDVVHLGVRAEVTPEWTALLETDWTNWKTFDALRVVSGNLVQPPDITDANWKATWMVALGAEYKPAGKWSYRAGVAFDPTPIPASTLEPRIPDGDRIIIAAGLNYAIDASSEVAFAASHLFVQGRTIYQQPNQLGNALRGTIKGSVEANANVITLQFAHRFD